MNKKYILMLLLGLFLIGCETNSAHPNIFENPTCQVPCWNNITPGITTKEETLTLLSKTDSIYEPVIDMNRSPGVGFDDEVRFSFYYKDNSLDGSIYFAKDRVSMISFGNGFGKQLNFRLQRAIELFGAPRYVLVIQMGFFDRVVFLNPQSGINFSYSLVGRQNLDNSPIGPETEISFVNFFDPNQYQQLLNSGLIEPSVDPDGITNRLFPWNGYGNPSQYQFPLPPNSSNVIHLEANILDFQTATNLKDVFTFYQKIFSSKGFKECTVETLITETRFTLVFSGNTGSRDGRPIVIKGGTDSVHKNITDVEIGYIDLDGLTC